MLLFFLEIIYPRIPGAIPPQDFIKTALPEDVLSLYAQYLVNLCIWAGAILALAGLIYGGIKYLLSSGKPEAMVSAKNQIASAFFGLLILLSSFLILKTISPEFISLKIPTLQTIQIEKKPIIPLPETTALNSSIDAEMPFARIIEKIFETYVSDYPAPDPAPTPRLERIKNNANAIKTITAELLSQSESLKEAAGQCKCEVLRPDPPCNHYGCDNCPPEHCTCDPCKNSRGKIQDNEDKNKTEINNLESENIKIEQEIQDLKEWLDRLKMAEKSIKECPFRALNSLAQFYSKKDSFNNNDWTSREIKLWDDININYYDKYKIRETDFATFYCSVGGTMEQEVSYVEPSSDLLTGEESEEEAEEILSESMACSEEAAVGEIIDRAKRTTQLLIDKLEQLVPKNKELVGAVDKLQQLVSQCSSRNCTPQCQCISCGHSCTYCLEIGCFGEPCDMDAISNQLEEVKRIQEEIINIIEGGENESGGEFGGGEGGEFGGGGASGSWEGGEEKKDAAITTIINQVIPAILQDLNSAVRITMKQCSSDDWLEQSITLSKCLQTKGAIIPPNNQVLRECCQAEAIDPETGEIKQTPFGDCLEQCYLETGITKYRKCLRTCLNQKAQQLNDPDIANCIHELNFYCCHAK